MREACGICGVASLDAPLLVYRMLVQLQHRGQLSAGMTTFHPGEKQILKTHKDLGLVNSVFRAEHSGKFSAIMQKHKSALGIGHVRYATSGADDKSYAQPFERLHGRKSKWFSVCFNGNIANYSALKAELEEGGYHLVHDTDTEILMHLFSKALKDTDDIVKVFSKVSSRIDGAYSIGFIDAGGRMIAARDPLGIKPLSYGLNGTKIAFASESVALNSIGFEDTKELLPGEMIIVENNSHRVERFAESKESAHCFFEWVYFAHPATNIAGRLVYSARNALGKELAKLETQKIDSDCVVVPVPDSSVPAGDGFAEALNLPLREGLIRNRYLGRTFIESNNRDQKVMEKFLVLREVMEGKRIFLVEDSIVRGTTLKNLVSFIRRFGKPKEIHVRVSCPPILWPCFYGIDMSSRRSLIAAQESDEHKMVEAVRARIGADSLIYQSHEGLARAIGVGEKNLCTACISGKYKTPWGEKLRDYEGEGRAQEQ